MLARKIFFLYEQYPNATIYQNLLTNTEEKEYENDSIVSIDKYVSFCADDKGLLFETLFETVNSEFQECTTMEEPTVIKKFDGKWKSTEKAPAGFRLSNNNPRPITLGNKNG